MRGGESDQWTHTYANTRKHTLRPCQGSRHEVVLLFEQCFDPRGTNVCEAFGADKSGAALMCFF